jgi:hypothetical protein
MILAFAAMAGLLFWLNQESAEFEDVPVPQEDTAAVAVEDTAGTGAAQAVTAMELRTGTASYMGQMVRVSGVPVAMNVGDEIFMIDLGEGDTQALFPVHLDSVLTARGEAAPPSGATVTVAGTVQPVNDSIVTAWLDAGAISEGDRPIVEYATHYVDARRIQAESGSGSGSGGAGAGAGSGDGSP